MAGAQEPGNVSTQCQRIAWLGAKYPRRSFTSLAHHIDVHWLAEAYRRTRKDAAPGVDGQSAEHYGRELATNLAGLLERVKSGQYRAPPVRRVHIPKGDGVGSRPIGIPTFEDKLLQRAVAMVLAPIFEGDFHPDSYGFRPGRSAHQALAVLDRRLTQMGGGWVLELDIQAYFDTIDHGQLRSMLRQRVSDGVITRLIGQWLNAGVMEAGYWYRPGRGSPQGGVISPLLANLYLHHVLDRWFAREVQPRLIGRSHLLRYADDAVLVFANEHDARRVQAVLARRFARFGLTLHPTKTRLVYFRPPVRGRRRESFELLGFTHYWARSRRGGWMIKRRTAKDRFRRGVKRIRQWCRRNRHRPIREQHEALRRQLQGLYNYYGIRGNYRALARLRYCVERVWLKWLGRRSQRGWLSWGKAARLMRLYALPTPRIHHDVLA